MYHTVNMSGQADGVFYYNIRSQTCFEAILLACYYPFIGNYYMGPNWLLLYRAKQNVEKNLMFF